MDESKSGIVLFTYPKASTPGCRHSTVLEFGLLYRFHVLHLAACDFRNETFDILIQFTSLGTTQACLFRDDFTPLTATGYSIYGLSTDSPKSNTTFKTKQSLPYTLLCDPAATLINAIGMKKAPSGTTRGVFVVNKDGKVEAVSPGVSLLLCCVCEFEFTVQSLTRVLLLPLMSSEKLSVGRTLVTT